MKGDRKNKYRQIEGWGRAAGRQRNRINLNRVGDTAMHIWTKSARKEKKKLADEDPYPFRHVSRIVDAPRPVKLKFNLDKEEERLLRKTGKHPPIPRERDAKKSKVFFILSPRRQRTETLVPLPHYLIS